MNSEQIHALLKSAVPFSAHLGLDVIAVGPGSATVRLPDDERLRNHVGSQHAGALFSCAESASGAAMLAALGEDLARFTPLAKSAQIAYRKVARGPIDAVATLAEGREALLARAEAEGKTEFDVKVVLSDATALVVAEVTVRWHLRKNG